MRLHTARKRGYILVALMLSLVFLLGVSGLAVDIGRMYLVKSEAQSFVDSAAVAAAIQLDGSAAGITRAAQAPAGDPKKWGFGMRSFTSVNTTFATSVSGPWTASPATPTGYYYVRVITQVTLPMYLIRVVAAPQAQVAAAAVAGRIPLTKLVNGGEFPFSPYTRTTSPNPDDPSDPYGFKKGNLYTLRWGAPGTRTSCGTDAVSLLPTLGNIRGYCCVSQSAADLRQAIVSGMTDPVEIGQPVPMDNAAKNTEMSSIAWRVDQDSDTTSANYATYRSLGRGNGERVVVVPVNSGPPNYTNLGFAGFFLLNHNAYATLNGNDSACAEYIGAWVKGVPAPQPGGTGAFALKLLQ